MGSFPMVPYPRMKRRPGSGMPTVEDLLTNDEYDPQPASDPYDAPLDSYRDNPNIATMDTFRRLRAPGPVEAEDSPINSRLRLPRPDFVGDYDRSSRSDPNLQQASMMRQGVTPDEYAALHTELGPGPSRPVRNEHAQRGGLLGTLKNIGRGALFGLGHGGVGGAAVGALYGGVSPQAMENVDYTYNRMPRYQREADQYNKEIGQREVLADRIGNRVGFDPISGKETPGQEDRRENRRFRERQLELLDEDRDAREEGRRLDRDVRRMQITRMGDDRDEAERARRIGLEDRAYATWLQHGLDRPVTQAEAERMGRPELVGQKPPVSTKPDYQGANLELRLRGMQQSEGHHQDAMDMQERARSLQERKDADSVVNDFEKLKKEATKWGEARNLPRQANGQIAFEGRYYTPAELQTKAEAAEAEFRGARERAKNHPLLELDQSGVGVRFRRSATSGNSKDPRIGKIATAKDGTQWVIDGIDENGDPYGHKVPKK